MGTRRQLALDTVWFSIVGNSLLVVIKGATGVFGNSYALIADAIESTTDVFSSFFVLLGLKYATKPADQNHPYGHGRAEPLITFAVVGFLLVAATVIAYESVQHIMQPHKIPEPFTLIVLGIIIIVKEASYQFVSRRSDITNSSALKADAWHHRSDALTSLTAFVGISIALYMGDGYETADDWAALIASGFITFNAYLIFRPALGELMDEQLHDDLVLKIRDIAKDSKGVIDTEKCFVRKTGMSYHVDLHLVVSGDSSVRVGHDIAHRLKSNLQDQLPEISDVLIHVEPDD